MQVPMRHIVRSEVLAGRRRESVWGGRGRECEGVSEARVQGRE